jgi:hypothetical protein
VVVRGSDSRDRRWSDRPSGDAGRAHPGSIEAVPLIPRDSGRAIGVSFVRSNAQEPHDGRIVLWDKRSTSAPAFRELRDRLIERGDPRTILCTSASRGEGKTTLATNLALAYAELGRARVLLIEASLRVAVLCELLGFQPPIGFGAQLARHGSDPNERWVVVQVGMQPFFVLAAEPRRCPQCAASLPDEKDARFCGQCGATIGDLAAGALDVAGFAAAVRRLRESFDYLLIDAPPVLGDEGVKPLQGAADAIVLAALKGRSSARELRQAALQLTPAAVAAVALLDG